VTPHPYVVAHQSAGRGVHIPCSTNRRQVLLQVQYNWCDMQHRSCRKVGGYLLSRPSYILGKGCLLLLRLRDYPPTIVGHRSRRLAFCLGHRRWRWRYLQQVEENPVSMKINHNSIHVRSRDRMSICAKLTIYTVVDTDCVEQVAADGASVCLLCPGTDACIVNDVITTIKSRDDI
jgi:hypothetical protein